MLFGGGGRAERSGAKVSWSISGDLEFSDFWRTVYSNYPWCTGIVMLKGGGKTLGIWYYYLRSISTTTKAMRTIADTGTATKMTWTNMTVLGNTFWNNTCLISTYWFEHTATTAGKFSSYLVCLCQFVIWLFLVHQWLLSKPSWVIALTETFEDECFFGQMINWIICSGRYK